ncbi:hypothetical protein N7540_011634 [Penicillium herquei]|nr:hypothetical protein N7540_011634 [Penicillium herquei]
MYRNSDQQFLELGSFDDLLAILKRLATFRNSPLRKPTRKKKGTPPQAAQLTLKEEIVPLKYNGQPEQEERGR